MSVPQDSQSPERLCRFIPRDFRDARVGAVIDGDRVVDLTAAGVGSLTNLLDADDPAAAVRAALAAAGPGTPLAEVALLPPVERQEVWAAGVTYLRSMSARME